VGRAVAASIGRSFNACACPRKDFRRVFFLRKIFRNSVHLMFRSLIAAGFTLAKKQNAAAWDSGALEAPPICPLHFTMSRHATYVLPPKRVSFENRCTPP
jgi:hypothetical protein